MHNLLTQIKRDNFNKHIKEIVALVEAQDVVISALREENNFLKNKYDENEEIKELKKRLREESYKNLNGFPITEEEAKAIEEWQEKHEAEVHNGSSYAGAIGGRYSYHFVPTSISTLGYIECSCGAQFTFSEIE